MATTTRTTMSARTIFDVTMATGATKVVRVCAESIEDAMSVAKQERPNWIPLSAVWVDAEGQESSGDTGCG